MKSVVLLSGGIDSTVALAMSEHAELALSFNYGQTHANRELDSARAVAKHYDIEHHVIDLRHALDTPSALTNHGAIPEAHADEPDATFVPGRNLVLIAVATAWANAWGYQTVVIGANADDRAGYPDCRPAFISHIDDAARAGYGVGLWAPLLKMNKREIVRLGHSIDAPLDLTWSCYRGGRLPCHRCGACQQREEAGL